VLIENSMLASSMGPERISSHSDKLELERVVYMMIMIYKYIKEGENNLVTFTIFSANVSR